MLSGDTVPTGFSGARRARVAVAATLSRDEDKRTMVIGLCYGSRVVRLVIFVVFD